MRPVAVICGLQAVAGRCWQSSGGRRRKAQLPAPLQGSFTFWQSLSRATKPLVWQVALLHAPARSVTHVLGSISCLVLGLPRGTKIAVTGSASRSLCGADDLRRGQVAAANELFQHSLFCLSCACSNSLRCASAGTPRNMLRPLEGLPLHQSPGLAWKHRFPYFNVGSLRSLLGSHRIRWLATS